MQAEPQAAMRDLGVVITAGAPDEAPRVNVSGYPALCVCAGFGSGSLPVTVQIVGKPFQDAMVLRAGDALEKATAFQSRRPTMVA